MRHLRETSAVNGLVHDVLLGRISRREAVRRGALLGLSASAMAALKVKSHRVASAQGDVTVPVPEGLRTDLAGQSISVVVTDDGPNVDYYDARVADFIEATGINVERVSRPQSATDYLANLLRLFSAEAADLDAVMIDVIWPGILAAHALDLSEAMTWQGNEYFERIVQNNTVNDILVGIPWFTDAGLLYTRTDLSEKYGYEGAPATWDELEERAAAIQEGERTTSPDFQGFVWQGNAYEGLTCNALEWQVSNGGGEIIEADGTVSVNNPNAIAAFERARGWVGTISPEGVTTYQEEDARGVWQAGNAAFMRNWPYAYSLGQQPDAQGNVPVIADKFMVSVLPMGSGEGARNADTLGGWQMMASRYSAAPEAAVEFCKYMTSIELQTAGAINLSLLPTIPSVYDDPAVLEVNPFFAQLKDVFLGGAVARPSTVSADLYNEVSIAYFTAVHEIITGQTDDAAGRVASLAEELEDIMAQL